MCSAAKGVQTHLLPLIEGYHRVDEHTRPVKTDQYSCIASGAFPTLAKPSRILLPVIAGSFGPSGLNCVALTEDDLLFILTSKRSTRLTLQYYRG